MLHSLRMQKYVEALYNFSWFPFSPLLVTAKQLFMYCDSYCHFCFDLESRERIGEAEQGKREAEEVRNPRLDQKTILSSQLTELYRTSGEFRRFFPEVARWKWNWEGVCMWSTAWGCRWPLGVPWLMCLGPWKGHFLDIMIQLSKLWNSLKAFEQPRFLFLREQAIRELTTQSDYSYCCEWWLSGRDNVEGSAFLIIGRIRGIHSVGVKCWVSFQTDLILFWRKGWWNWKMQQ